jgi:abortive infection bacteriophage resistance protein
MAYNKPWKSYPDQLEQLMQRGLIVTNQEKALNYLKRIGYYRLSGYWYPFRKRSSAGGQAVLDTFKDGASFQNAVDLYVFDKKLRLLVLDALERIEIALRVDISHTLGKKDPFAHTKPEFLANNFAKKVNKNTGVTQHKRWLDNHDGLVSRSKETFIEHNRNKYGLPLPVWVACEIWDFGTLSKLFAGMKPEDKNAIAKKYGVSNGKVFQSWLRSLNYLRNVCAHHSRLWNRNIVDRPQFPGLNDVENGKPFLTDCHINQRVFFLLCISQHLLNIINPSSTWGQRLRTLLLEFPNLRHLELDLTSMGTLEGWEEWNW